MIDKIKNTTPFDLLEAADFDRLSSGLLQYQVGKGEMIVQRDDLAAGMYIVCSGEVKCSLLSSSGNEQIVRLAGPGTTFGEEAALLSRPQVVTAQATMPSSLVLLRTPALHEAMAASPAFALAITEMLAVSAYELTETMYLCLQRTSVQRVAHYLVQLVPGDVDRCEIRLESDKQTIAAQLNLTPETLSRVLSRFARAGVIRTQGRRGVELRDVPTLRSYAQH